MEIIYLHGGKFMKKLGKKSAVAALAALLTLTCVSSVFADVTTPSNVTTPSQVVTTPSDVTPPAPVTTSPDAIPSNPDASTSTSVTVTTSSDAVEAVTDKYVIQTVAADGTVTVQYSDRNNSGTVLKAGDGILPNGAQFKQSTLSTGAEYDKAAAAVKSLLPAATNFFVYEFDITANGVEVHQLGDYVKVTLARPADFVIGAGQQLVVYRLEDNGTLTRCECAVNEHSISFLTNHFSTYIFAVENIDGSKATTGSTTKSPKTGE